MKQAACLCSDSRLAYIDVQVRVRIRANVSVVGVVDTCLNSCVQIRRFAAVARLALFGQEAALVDWRPIDSHNTAAHQPKSSHPQTAENGSALQLTLPASAHPLLLSGAPRKASDPG